MKTKSVEWSYPTSSNAKRFGFAAVGCWTVETQQDINAPIAVAGFADRQEALTAARKMPLPWSAIFARWNPKDLDHPEDQTPLTETRCQQCGKIMGTEVFLGPVCGKCCRQNHQAVAGR